MALSFATTLSATIPCAPLLALLASGVTVAGLIANVLAAPLGALAGLVLTLLVVVAARPIAALYHEPSLTGLIIVSSLTYTVSLTVVPLALLERELNLKPAALSEIGAAVLSSIAGIVAASMGAVATATSCLVRISASANPRASRCSR